MSGPAAVTLFLCGDVMIGRGIDQVLAHSCPPRLYEPYVDSALEYVALAEAANGPIPRGVGPAYVWGDTLAELERRRPDARIANLETALTLSEDALPKGINYRAHPANVAVLSAARFDCCVLANNHVLDWGEDGLCETLAALSGAGIAPAGAGRDRAAAEAPAVLDVGAGRRVLVFAAAAADSGVPPGWAAGDEMPGVALLPDLSERTADALAARVQAVDSGLGQVVTQNVAQAKQISDVSSRLASHRHSYTYLDVGWTNEYFVKESGGIGSADKKSLASYVSSKTQQTGTTGPAQ
jgi:poly-gamma-glutamate synthesis protein (capsule biosynthesis protein)